MDREAIVYYRYERILEDIGEFGTSVSETETCRRHRRAPQVALAESIFGPGGMLETVERGVIGAQARRLPRQRVFVSCRTGDLRIQFRFAPYRVISAEGHKPRDADEDPMDDAGAVAIEPGGSGRRAGRGARPRRAFRSGRLRPPLERHRLAVFRYLRTRTRSEDDAVELTAVAFERAITAMPRYRPTGGGILAWLLRIARNAAIDAGRRASAVPLDAESRTSALHRA